MAEKTWRKRLTEAKKRGCFLESDLALAREWGTCPVGEHTSEFRASTLGGATPHDDSLTDLGCRFVGRVAVDQIAEAEFVYKQIQAWFRRSAKRRKAKA